MRVVEVRRINDRMMMIKLLVGGINLNGISLMYHKWA